MEIADWVVRDYRRAKRERRKNLSLSLLLYLFGVCSTLAVVVIAYYVM